MVWFPGDGPPSDERPTITLLGAIGVMVMGAISSVIGWAMMYFGSAFGAAQQDAGRQLGRAYNGGGNALLFGGFLLTVGLFFLWCGGRWGWKSFIAIKNGDSTVEDP